MKKKFFNVIRLAPIMPLEERLEYDLEYSFRSQSCTSVSSSSVSSSSVSSSATMKSSYEELYEYV